MKYSKEWGWTRDTDMSETPAEVAHSWLWLIGIGALTVLVAVFYSLPRAAAKLFTKGASRAARLLTPG